jgi:hypothetical protein
VRSAIARPVSTTPVASFGSRLLLMNDELGTPGLDLIVSDITKACPMFFPWTAESARMAATGSGEGRR